MASKKKSGRRSVSTGSVDVHCHVFNAQDVPVRKFVELVYLEKYPGGSLLDPLIDFIEYIMRSGAPTTREEIDELTHAGLRLVRLKPHGTRAYNIRVVSHALEQMWNRSSKDQQWVRQHFSPQLRKHFGNKRQIAVTPTHFRQTAQYLMGLSDIGTWIKFALIYTKPRWEITQELVSLSATQAKDVFLYTPAVLDIGFPLGEGNTSDLGEQVEVMSLIAQIKNRNCAVHAFVAFDPFRASSDANVLATVKDAVLNKGAIGVKMYPPMGFKPCGNANSELDLQMKDILGFCLAEDVPILVHCSFSQFVQPADGVCAAPEAWQAFLKQDGHANLRLNLGHCGGPWDLAANPVTNTIWTETVIKLLGSSDYPHLYADLGDDSWILDPCSNDNMNLMNRLLGFLKDNPNARSRLLYGSDWSLLARETGANNYYASMKKWFGKLLNFTAAEQLGYLGGNALCFLGLAKNKDGSKPKNRQRLEKFRSSKALDMSIFSKIDALRPEC
jgi:predicted TIM-barrel fold metal-dependent hydrolase